MLAPLGFTLPLATVTLMVTSAVLPDGSVVFDGVLVCGAVAVPVGVVTVVGAVLGLDPEPASELPPQPARTSMPRAGSSASAVPRESVERMRAGAFQQVGSEVRARGTHPLA